MNLTDRLREVYRTLPTCNRDKLGAIGMQSLVCLVQVLFANGFTKDAGDVSPCCLPHARACVWYTLSFITPYCAQVGFVIYPIPDAGLNSVCGIDNPSGLRVYVLETIVLCVFQADVV